VPTLASVDAARIKLQVVVCSHWQCCGSASFRPVLRTPWHFGTDPTPDPAIFINDLQDGK
jgi:hypothetical protein